MSQSHPSQAELEAYLRRELPPQDRRRVYRHVVVCAQCRARLDSEAELGQSLASLQAIRPPGRLGGNLPQILAQSLGGYRVEWGGRHVVAAGYFLLLLMAAFLIQPRAYADPASPDYPALPASTTQGQVKSMIRPSLTAEAPTRWPNRLNAAHWQSQASPVPPPQILRPSFEPLTNYK
jgi:anti-sigma factor RsiW